MILLRHAQSHFNVHFAKTRRDPGIVDPELTEEGLLQAENAALALKHLPLKKIRCSPYTRTLQTACILAERLALPLEIDPIIREQAFFTCDIGSPRTRLEARFPDLDFGDLPEVWWPELNETDEELLSRCRSFRRTMAAREDWADWLVVSHWAFIRGLTGEGVANATHLSFDPRPESAASA
jgi:broad specificity phosphatase PhoE